jgi:hypothetical protein
MYWRQSSQSWSSSIPICWKNAYSLLCVPIAHPGNRVWWCTVHAEKNPSGIAPCCRRVRGTKCSKNMCKLNKTVYYCSTFEDSALQIIYSIESFKCCQTEVFLRALWKGSCKAKSLVKSNLERRFTIKMASHGDALLVRSSTVLFEVLPQMMSLLAIHRVKPNINPHGIWFLINSNQLI